MKNFENIMDNVEVIDVPAEDFVPKASSKGLVILGVMAGAVTASVVLVKKVIIPAIQKHKAKQEAENAYQYVAPIDADFEPVNEE